MNRPDLSVLRGLFSPTANDAPCKKNVWLFAPQSEHSIRASVSDDQLSLSLVIQLSGLSRLKHLWRFLMLRVYLWSAKRTLWKAGFRRFSVYAVYPTLEDPFAIYEVGSDAQKYAESRVLQTGHDITPQRRLLRYIAGVEPAISALVLAGHRGAS